MIRLLVVGGKAYRFKKGDGADLCHSIAAGAFATFATLDKQWKGRMGRLPKPNQLAAVYYEPELDQLVTDLEVAVESDLSSHAH